MMCLFCYRENIRVQLTPTNRVFSPPTDGPERRPPVPKTAVAPARPAADKPATAARTAATRTAASAPPARRPGQTSCV